MKLKTLTKPMKGISFWIWRFLLHFNFAKTFYWGEDVYKGRSTYLFSIHIVQRHIETNDKVIILKALTIIILPIKMTIGYTNPNE